MPSLNVDNLRVGYHEVRAPRGRHRLVVDGVSFSAGLGCTAIIGDNASGKTSLLHGLLDQRKRISGTVLLDGEALGPGEVGYVPQSPALTLSGWLTVGDECVLARRIAGEARARSYADLDKLMRDLGISLPLSRRVEETSGGQRVLIAIVRAMMVPRVRLYILDEPYEGLSPRTRDVVTRVLAAAAAQHPVLVTSHRTEDLVQLNARILRLVGQPARALEVVLAGSVPSIGTLTPTISSTESEAVAEQSDQTYRREAGHWRHAAQTLAGIVAGLAIWWVTARGVDHPGLIPDPIRVLESSWALTTDPALRAHFLATVARAIASWVLAMTMAVPIGICLGYNELVYRLVSPWVSVARCVPVFALAGTAIGIFPGLPDVQRMFLIVAMLWLIALQAICLATFVSPRRRLDLARVLGAGAWFRVRHVLVNEVKGSLLGAAETLLPLSIIVTFVVETTLLPRYGLGQYVYNHMTDPDLSTVWSFLLVPAVLAAAGVLLIRSLARRTRREI